MKKPKSITRFTIETERTFIFRCFEGQITARCVTCGAETQMATVQDAAREAGLSELAIYRLLDEGVLHFTEDSGGRVFVCLNSLVR